MYFFNDAPAIAVKVTKNQKKSFYGSYSISKGADAEGRIKSTGRYKYICRVGEKPISLVKETVINNIKKWKAETVTGKGDDVAALSKDFRANALNGLGGNEKDAKGQYARTGITYDDGYNYWYSVEKNGAQDNWFIERGKDFSK